ncbi:MAG: FAD-binding oxidoreductase [Planctomycetota bacterium]
MASPVDADDLSGLVSWAVREGVALIPRGGGTGMPGGNVGPGVVVDLSGWTGVGTLDPESRSVWVGPGLSGQDLSQMGERSGLFFPAMPSSADRCRIGGMVANNAAGARSFGYGAVKDWIEALEVVLADGSLVTLRRRADAPALFSALHKGIVERWGETIRDAWPDVAKNSSGYALDAFAPAGDPVSLLVGSEGTLGLVARVQLRLEAEPTARTLVLVALPSADGLVPVAEAARTVGAAACEFFGRRFLEFGGLTTAPETQAIAREAEALMMVEVDGAEDAVHERTGRFIAALQKLGLPHQTETRPAERQRLWSLRHAASPAIAARAAEGLVSMQFIEDSVVPLAALPMYLARLQDILDEEQTDAVMFGHAGDGNVHVNPLIDVRQDDWRARVDRILRATASLVASLGGTLSGEHGDGRVRAPFHAQVFGTELDAAFRHVKQTLDPDGVLNPGVIVPLEGQDPLDGISHRRSP